MTMSASLQSLIIVATVSRLNAQKAEKVEFCNKLCLQSTVPQSSVSNAYSTELISIASNINPSIYIDPQSSQCQNTAINGTSGICWDCCVDIGEYSTSEDERWRLLYTVNQNIPAFSSSISKELGVNVTHISYAASPTAQVIDPTCTYLPYPRICNLNLSALSTSNSIPPPFTFTMAMDTIKQQLQFRITTPYNRWFGIGFGTDAMYGDAAIYSTGKDGNEEEGIADWWLMGTNIDGSLVFYDSQQDYTDLTKSVTGREATYDFKRYFIPSVGSHASVDKWFDGAETSVDIFAALGDTDASFLLSYHDDRTVLPVNVLFTPSPINTMSYWCVDPTLIGDCIIELIAPTKEPTNAPTITPVTISPSRLPSNYPPHSPSNYPSHSPVPPMGHTPNSTSDTTSYPSSYPSLPPVDVSYTTLPLNSTPTTLEQTYVETTGWVTDSEEKHQSELDDLSDLYQMSGGAFMVVFTSLTILSSIDARCIRINDYFKVGGIISMMIHTADMMSDCFFVAELSIQSKIRSEKQYTFVFYGSMLFIMLPALIALFQLYKYTRKHWLDNDYVRSWLSKYITILLLVSVITGSSFAAVSLLNSYIFQIELFDMGLRKKELTGFNTRRVYSIVLFENLPQLALQTYYLYLQSGVNNPITISSIAFSIISIIVSVLSMTVTKAINYTQRYVIISMDITGECVEQKVSKCRTMNRLLKKRIGILIGVDQSMIEVMKPTYIANGFEMSIYVYVNMKRGNEKTNYAHIMKESNNNGKLPEAFHNAWGLSAVPMISNISTVIVESKEDQKVVKAKHLTQIHNHSTQETDTL